LSSAPLKAPGDGSRLSTLALLTFTGANMPYAALSIAVFVFLPPYFAGHLGVGMGIVGGVWMGVRLFDIPVDILLALGMDRTRTPIGRYRFWLVLGAPILMLGLYKLFMAPHGFDATFLTIWLLVLYLGMSITTLAVSAWGATLATQYHERSRLFGVMTALGVAGAMTVLLIPILGQSFGRNNAQSVQTMGWFIIILTPVTMGLAALRTPEVLAPVFKRQKTPELGDVLAVLVKPDLLRLFFAQVALTLGPGWMSAIYLFFFTQAWRYTLQQASLLLALYILAGIPGALGGAAIARRIGKHRALMVSAVAFSAGLTAVLIVPKGNVLAAAPLLIWSGAMSASFNLTIQAMLADVGDEVRLDQGKERLSLLYAMNGLAQKIAAAFSIGLTFPLLARLGFNPADGAHNTPQALTNLSWAFIAGPTAFVMMGAACVVGWRLDARRQGEIREALALRDSQIA
jgi:Na+/melibiose symporter-like transporter